MMKIQIINGPNLNLLGIREPGIYGHDSFDDYLAHLRTLYPEIEIDYYQSNVEGYLIDRMQEVGFDCDGIVLNAGAYTHTSIAILDALKAVALPAAEVHITDIAQREPFRQVSYAGMACQGHFIGQGLQGYLNAVRFIRQTVGAEG